MQCDERVLIARKPIDGSAVLPASERISHLLLVEDKRRGGLGSCYKRFHIAVDCECLSGQIRGGSDGRAGFLSGGELHFLCAVGLPVRGLR